MERRYLAFDIETSKILPEFVPEGLLAHRPLGICCAATYAHGETEPRIWHGRSDQNRPTHKMTIAEACELVTYLESAVSNGFTILTWNGLGFDFNVLAEESGMWNECRLLARHHVDLMFHFFCEKGFGIKLEYACTGMKLKGKSSEMSGLLAPQAWADGRHDEVLMYNSQDVIALMELGLACEKRRKISWTTTKGTVSSQAVPSGLLTVEVANKLPFPDTSWMKDPWKRSRFMAWLTPQ